MTHRVHGARPRGLVFQGGEIGTVNNTTLVAHFSKPVAAVGNDFTSGITIKEAGAGKAIVSGTLQADTTVVYYVLAVAVAAGALVTLEYSTATGIITDAASLPLPDFGATQVKNNV